MAVNFEIEVQLKKNQIAINSLKRDLKSIQKETEKSNSYIRKFGSSIKNLAAAAVGFIAIQKGISGVSAAGKELVKTAATFEKFKIALTTIEKSSLKAQSSLDWVKDFAATTPYSVEEITEAFIKLRANGLDPMDGTLRTLGDSAAAFGKDLMQGVEAIIDFQTGESERLKEAFSLKVDAKTFADSYLIPMGNGYKRVSKEGKAGTDAILDILKTRFEGGMDDLSKSFDGKLSNFEDSWTDFKLTLATESGLFDGATKSLDILNEEFSKMKNNKETMDALSLTVKDFATSTVTSVFAVADAFIFLKSSISDTGDAFEIAGNYFQKMAIDFDTYLDVNGYTAALNEMKSATGELADDISNFFVDTKDVILDFYDTVFNNKKDTEINVEFRTKEDELARLDKVLKAEEEKAKIDESTLDIITEREKRLKAEEVIKNNLASIESKIQASIEAGTKKEEEKETYTRKVQELKGKTIEQLKEEASQEAKLKQIADNKALTQIQYYREIGAESKAFYAQLEVDINKFKDAGLEDIQLEQIRAARKKQFEEELTAKKQEEINKRLELDATYYESVGEKTNLFLTEQKQLEQELIESGMEQIRIKEILAQKQKEFLEATRNEVNKNDDLFSGFSKGIDDAMSKTKDSILSNAELANKVGSQSINSLQGGLESFFDSTSEDFMNLESLGKNVLKSLLSEIAKLIAKQLAAKAIMMAFGGGFADGGAFVGGTQAYAKGGAFSGGVEAFATGGAFTNQIVSSPTFFPMSGNKTGLMGEAGPEAIMPLKRMGDGSLGVRVEGTNSGGSVAIQNVININNMASDTVKVQESKDSNGNTRIDIVKIDAMLSNLYRKNDSKSLEVLKNTL